jgi:hypothetical protein
MMIVIPAEAGIAAINRRESSIFPTPSLQGLSPRETMVEMSPGVRLMVW